jgi:PAS domain S-box-containing protein
LPDCPLTFANATFCKQTGYPIEEVIGRNCRFLQCGESSRDVINAMGDCFKQFQKRRRQGIPVGARTFRVINAKKDGTRFLNMVHMAPLYDRNNTLVRILGVQYGLQCVTSSEFNRAFQGVIVPDSAGGDYESTSDCLGKWRGWAPVSQVGVASQTEAIAHMQEVMASCINDICKLVDFDQMELVATEASERVACTLALKRPFECEAGGPCGKPLQGMVSPGRKRRTVALAGS